MVKTKKYSSLFICMVVLILSISMTAHAEPSTYIHNPMDNPKAAKDIVVNDDAVYGFSPNPESERLGSYASYDWTDEATVAEMRADREAYHESVSELYQMISTMKENGNTVEEIARAVSTRRNEIRIESYKDDPEGLGKLKQSNLATYGNENGGTPEYFYEKYGSWETVIEKSLSTNAGADACLGLYDKYYDTYFIATTASTTDTYIVQAGDTLNSIAESLYGDKYIWRQIYNNNKNIIEDPNLIYPGQELYLKDISPAA